MEVESSRLVVHEGTADQVVQAGDLIVWSDQLLQLVVVRVGPEWCQALDLEIQQRNDMVGFINKRL